MQESFDWLWTFCSRFQELVIILRICVLQGTIILNSQGFAMHFRAILNKVSHLVSHLVMGGRWPVAGDPTHFLVVFCVLDSGYSETSYSAAQIYPNQNIRIIRVSPIRVYAYGYTHIRVFVYAHTRIQYICVCLIGMYELTYWFFFC